MQMINVQTINHLKRVSKLNNPSIFLLEKQNN